MGFSHRVNAYAGKARSKLAGTAEQCVPPWADLLILTATARQSRAHQPQVDYILDSLKAPGDNVYTVEDYSELSWETLSFAIAGEETVDAIRVTA